MENMKIVMLSVVMSWCLYGCCVEHFPLDDAGDGGCVIDNDADAADSDTDAAPCEVPTGDYVGTLRYTGGDCTLEENLDGTPGGMSIGANVQCGPAWFMFLDRGENCSYATLYRAEGDANGLLPSTRVTMTTSCDGGYTCTNTYTIDLEPESE